MHIKHQIKYVMAWHYAFKNIISFPVLYTKQMSCMYIKQGKEHQYNKIIILMFLLPINTQVIIN
jgi:hypothetical protein